MSQTNAAAANALAITAPYDRAAIGDVPTQDWSEVDAMFGKAVALYENRDAWLPMPKRVEILARTAEIMTERAEELATAAAREGGKPLLDSRVEVARAIDGVQNCIEVLRTEQGEVIPMNVNAASAGRFAFTRREPIGVVPRSARSIIRSIYQSSAQSNCPPGGTRCGIGVSGAGQTGATDAALLPQLRRHPSRSGSTAGVVSNGQRCR